MKRIVSMALMVFVCSFCPNPIHAKGELAKASQNPVGDIISVPMEYWHYHGIANDSSVDALIVKPVYPLNLGSINLINRLILPLLSVDANVGGSDVGTIPPTQTEFDENGLGNVEKPVGGPEWSLQFAVKLLFPK